MERQAAASGQGGKAILGFLLFAFGVLILAGLDRILRHSSPTYPSASSAYHTILIQEAFSKRLTDVTIWDTVSASTRSTAPSRAG